MKNLLLALLLMMCSCTSNPPKQGVTYKVIFDITMSSIELYPVCYNGFSIACEEWEKVLPVDIDINIVENFEPSSSNTEVSFIDFTDSSTIGIYRSSDDSISLSNKLNSLATLKQVSMHEIGHKFGLPHFASKERAKNDDYVIEGAENMIMYYMIGPNNTYSKLTEVEIEIAKKYLKL